MAGAGQGQVVSDTFSLHANSVGGFLREGGDR